VSLKRLIPVALVALFVVSGGVAIGLGFDLGQEGSDARERSDVLGNAAPSLKPRPPSEAHIGSAFPARLTRPPTADEGQSKLWFHDGSWWGVLMDRTTSANHIYRLEADSRTWTDTGVVVDERVESRSDVLADGDRLYVVTGGASPSAGEHGRLMRYSYDADSRAYRLDRHFPLQLTDTGVKRLTIAKDTAGTLWIAYVLDGQVWISHSLANDHSWATPQVLPTDGPSVPAEQAIILAYGGKIGVVWTNRVESRVSFASHTDGDASDAWTVTSTPLEGGLPADDHMEVGSLSGPEGTTVFIVVKTSLDTRDASLGTDPQVLLLELRPDGEWENHVFGVLRDHHTQPLLLINEDTRELYVFAVAPFGQGTVYYKRTSADEISLPPGAGTAFLHWTDGPVITTPTSTKQNVGAASGLVVLAADVTTNQYVHGVLDLAHETEP
jgi:hypothetical protein